MRQMIAILGVTLLAVTSCSIKEDRSKCPCWVQIDMSEADCETLTITGWDSDRLFIDEIEESRFEDFYEVTVPRGWTYFSAVSVTRHKLSGSTLMIEKGCQSDSLYGHSTLMNTNCETAVDKVELHKQFATVNLVMELPDGFEQYPYRVVIRSNTAGWNLRDFSGVSGTFCYEPERIGANEYAFRAPRQGDRSMMVDLYDDEELINTVKLGEIICDSGFNWDAQNLADISLDLHFKESVVLIHISDWSETIVMNVVI